MISSDLIMTPAIVDYLKIKGDRLSPILNISLTTKIGLISSTLITFFVLPGLHLQSTSNKAIATYQLYYKSL